jgi:hypothetical protein
VLTHFSSDAVPYSYNSSSGNSLFLIVVFKSHSDPALVRLLHHCDKIPEESNLKGERLILACGFRGSEHHSGEGMAEQSREVHIIASRKQRERGIKKEVMARYSSQGQAPVTNFVQPGPTFHSSIPILLSCYEFIKGLIHSLGQSFHFLSLEMASQT